MQLIRRRSRVSNLIIAHSLTTVMTFQETETIKESYYIFFFMLFLCINQPLTNAENDDTGGKGKIGQPTDPFPSQPPLLSKLKVERIIRKCTYQEVKLEQLTLVFAAFLLFWSEGKYICLCELLNANCIILVTLDMS